MSRLTLVVVFITILGSWGMSRDFKFQVRHDHNPWGDCLGEMTVSDSGIRYVSEEGEHSFNWEWTDIQSLDRKSITKFSLLSYEDQIWLAGRDRRLNFTVIEGSGFGQDVFSFIKESIPIPLVDRVAAPIGEPLYEVPVKHLHTLGGCEGILRFGREIVVYESSRQDNSRTWRKDTEITGIWSSGPYDIDITAREGSGRGGEKRFRFQLKEPLDEQFFFRLRRELLLQ